MSNTKHTPGPWTMINGNKYFPTVVMKEVAVPNEDVGTLNYPAPHFTVNCSHDQRMESIIANAKLIAAAPELLEALEQVLAYEKRCADHGDPKIGNGILSIIRTAIKKATE